MFHAQNLTDGRKPMWRHGRCWLGSWRAEWSLFQRPHVQAMISFGEDETTASVGVIFATLYVGHSHAFRNRAKRESGVRVFDNAIWLSFWSNPNEWNSRDPWWRQGVTWHPLDTFLGRRKYTSETISETKAIVPMPEGAYPCTVKLERCTWKRPRWIGFTRTRAEVSVPGGVPIEGKGENSWDCGEDRTYSSSFPAAKVEDAIGMFVGSTLETRRRHGVPLSAKTVHLSPAIAAPEPASA